MNIKSVYQQDFHRVNSFGDSLKVNRPVMRQQSSNLGKGSMYTKDFSPPRDSRMEKHGAPENNLNPKVGEVAPTSLYKAHYPGFVGERLPNVSGFVFSSPATTPNSPWECPSMLLAATKRTTERSTLI